MNQSSQRRSVWWAIGLACLLALPVGAADPARLELKANDRIAVIGNGLADRLQHDAWLDAFIQTRFPKLNLSFRHMGFTGDEIGGFTEKPDANRRLRSAAFGSNDEWLTRVKADVIIACFGYNESFGGTAGIAGFKKDLEAFIKHAQSQKYNGESAPRVVLVSPIPHQDLKSPNLPDGKANNARLAEYTAAMKEVAASLNVPFVDIYQPGQELYTRIARPLTINGIHLNEAGNKEFARLIDEGLFGPAPMRSTEQLEKVRKAAVDRNFHWFERFRTTDGYSIYGGRADLRFVGGQTNRVVAQREMEVLDVMTANRDKAVNALANGATEAKLDDSNLPAFIPVTTNKPGSGPNGKHLFLSGEEAIASMTTGKGIKVNLFADEKMFPELANPVQMAWDPAGRLWVAVWPSYPHWKPTEVMDDKLLVLEDTDGDGKADKCTTFAGGLHNPTGFEFFNGGVLVASAPDLVFLKDTDGDGKADVRERVLGGLDSADTHHTSNSFPLDPGGALYFQEGTFHHSQIEDPYGPPRRVANGAVFRYEPRTQKADIYVSYGFANPHGHAFDAWGQDIVVDGTGAVPYHAPLFSGRLPFPAKHSPPPTVYRQRTRPCPGIEYLSSRHFPAEFDGNLLVANVIGQQGILRYKIKDDGGSLKGTELEPILMSKDPNFRPTDLKTAPDGSLYFIDWHNPIIGHMQHNLRDPSRDREHGRIYRVTYEGRPLQKPVKIAGETVANLVALLGSPDDRVRYRAKIELGARPTGEVLGAAKAWLAERKPGKDIDYEHDRLEVLWLHQYHDVVEKELLKQVLASSDFRARAAATRVLCYWLERMPEGLEMLKTLAADTHPRVRLEAVRAASFIPMAEAVEVVLIAGIQAKDPFVDHVAGETMKALDPYVKEAIAKGTEIKFTTPVGARFFLKNIGNDDLVKMKRSPAVYSEFLLRAGLRDEFRREAITALAGIEKKSEIEVILTALKGQDLPIASESVTFDLTRLLTSRPESLKPIRAELESLATKAATPTLRQMGYVALVAADGSADPAWTLATKSVKSLRDLITAVPQIRDPGLRAALYPKVLALLDGLPPELAQGLPKKDGITGRFVRVELPGKQRTLTIAEVEVISDGRNVARQGKASQSSTAHGGEAKRAIDGNKNPSYNDGGQTHTAEGTDNPWWEVDLGASYPIDAIAVYNRADGSLGSRLANFTLKVLDDSKTVVYEKKAIPAPPVSTTLTISGESPERIIRRAAMVALTSVRGKEADTFRAIARFVNDPKERGAAITALQRIPAAAWPKESAAPLLKTLTEAIAKVPVADRTSPAVLEATQFAYALTGLLPKEDARAARKTLGEIGIRVIRVGTLTDQMLFDIDRMAVQAGKPVEFLFENTDIMPHNFVIVAPGALEEVGMAAEAFGTQPKAQERHFVPPSNKILLASRLLQPREGESIRFTAPTTPGIYPYVCTYPGHWRRMYGALYVVPDLDAYLDGPEEYLAKNPLPIRDDLLKFNRPRTEWKLEELAPAVKELAKAHLSPAHGKQLFSVATCVACHKFDGQGQDFGPDLTKLDPKEFKEPVDLLKHILDPSLKVDDKYKQYTFNLAAGGTVTGMVLEKSATGYQVIENPLAKAQPRLLKLDDLDGPPKPSAVSIMPKGLLDKLTKDEILDLLAYVMSKGDPKHPLYQGGHDHGGHKH